MEQTNLPPNQPVPSSMSETPPVNAPSSKKPILTILLIISLVILSSLITYLLVKSQTPSQTPIASPVLVTQSTPTPDPTANWKTYTNEKYGFEVKYNPDLNPTERSGDGETVGQFSYLQTISFGTNPIKSPYGYEVEVNKKSLGDYRTEIVGHIADKIDSEKEIIINSNSWTKITYKIFLTTDYVSVTRAVINHNEYGYAVTASATDIDQILSTFKFTDSLEKGTSDKCVTGGCNVELCLDESLQISSICVYKEAYICYKNAKCKRQSNGKCDWTQTEELQNCLAKYPPLK